MEQKMYDILFDTYEKWWLVKEPKLKEPIKKEPTIFWNFWSII